MRTKILGVSLVLLLSMQSAQALTGWQVVRNAVGVGLLTCAGLYWYRTGEYKFPFIEKDDSSDSGTSCSDYTLDDSYKAPLGWGLGATAVSAWIFSWWTANSRYRWARSKMTYLEKQTLYGATMTPESINRILQDSGCEYTELPLIEAFLRLRSYDETLRSVEDQLIQAIEDAGRHSYLGEKIEKLLKQVRDDLHRIRENETFVKNNDKTAWYEQSKIYERRELEHERLRQEFLMHTVPQTHAHYVVHHSR